MDKFRRKIQINGPMTVGWSDQGYDVVFNSATAGCNMTWDESADELDISATTEIQAAHKLQFRDTAIYINSTADAGLNLVADGAITLTSPSVTVAGELIVTGSMDVSSSTSLAVTQVGDGTNYTAFAADGLMSMVATARVIKDVWLPAKVISCNTNKNWTAGSHNSASTYAWQFTSSGTEGSALVGVSVPNDMDITATGSVDVLWSAGCVAAANASMAISYAYYGIGEAATPGAAAILTGIEASGTGGASAFEWVNVTDALAAPAASTKFMDIRLTFNPNTAESSAGSTFQLNGMILKYVANKLGADTA